MKPIFFLFLFSLPVFLFGQTREVEILIPSSESFRQLLKSGIVSEPGQLVKGENRLLIHAFLNTEEFSALERTGIGFNVLTENWENKYRTDLESDWLSLKKTATPSRVKSFRYGTMGGYLTYSQLTELLDSMVSGYPNLLSPKVSIGKSTEGRDLWMWKLSDNPNIDENEPEVLFTGLHHAREAQGMTSALYSFLFFVENYHTDSQIRYLIDNREIYFVPVVNPDGYVYNETTNPGGGGMWRKNRRLNEDFSYGVDLNRNYGVGWGFDNDGSSPDASTNVYRGTSPFSEKETQVIRDFCKSRQFKVALNYHSYGNLLMYPWGFTSKELTPDSVQFSQLAGFLTQTNHFETGTSFKALGYKTNGDADDWMYGDQTAKPKILALTPEVGLNNDGFWPMPSRILPIAESCLEQNIRMVWLAGGYHFLESTTINDEDHDGYYSPGEWVNAQFTIKNLGANAATQSTGIFSVRNLKDQVISSESVVIDPLESGQSSSLSFHFRVPDSISTGTQFVLRLNVENSENEFTLLSDTLQAGIPEPLFSDSFDGDLSKWSLSTGWTQVTNKATSLPSSLHESQAGNYPNRANYSITTGKPVRISSANKKRVLQFQSTWEIEPKYDKGQVLVSPDGNNWVALSGKFTSSGSGIGLQILNEPVYEGFQKEWVTEQIVLPDWKDSTLFIRFLFLSDGFTTYDGWYIDDFKVLEYSTSEPTSVRETNLSTPNINLYPPYPNPFNPQTQIPFTLSQSGQVTFIVFDTQGKEILNTGARNFPAGLNKIPFDGTNLPTGLYFFRLESEFGFKTGKITLLK